MTTDDNVVVDVVVVDVVVVMISYAGSLSSKAV